MARASAGVEAGASSAGVGSTSPAAIGFLTGGMASSSGLGNGDVYLLRAGVEPGGRGNCGWRCQARRRAQDGAGDKDGQNAQTTTSRYTARVPHLLLRLVAQAVPGELLEGDGQKAI